MSGFCRNVGFLFKISSGISRRVICLTFGISAFVFSDVELTTTVRDVHEDGCCQQLGNITMTVNNNDFRDASLMEPVFIRVRLQNCENLCETLVDQSQPGLIGNPIFLPMQTQATHLINAPMETVSIVRWAQGECAIWIRVQHSSDEWLLPVGQATPTSPSPSETVSWTLGISARQSWLDNRNAFLNDRANISAATRDVLNHEAPENAVSTLICMEPTDLMPNQVIDFNPIAFDDNADVGGGFFSGVAGNDTGINFTNDFQLGLVVPPVHCSLEMAGTPILAPACSPSGDGIVCATNQLTLTIDCDHAWGFNQASSIELFVPSNHSYGFPVRTSGGSPVVSSFNPDLVELETDALDLVGFPSITAYGSVGNLFNAAGKILSTNALIFYPNPGVAGPITLTLEATVCQSSTDPLGAIALGGTVLSSDPRAPVVMDIAPFDGQDQAAACVGCRKALGGIDWSFGEFTECVDECFWLDAPNHDDGPLINDGPVLECANDDSGDFSYNFDLTSHFPKDIHAIVVKGPTGVTLAGANSNNILLIELAQPLATNDTMTLSFGFSGAVPGSDLCFKISLHDETKNECCSEEICITVPDCDCLVVSEHRLVCETDEDGNQVLAYSFMLTNLSSTVVHHVWLDALGSANFEESILTLSTPLGQGDTGLVTAVIQNPTPGPFCFFISQHDEDFDFCCALQEEVCLNLPECNGLLCEAPGSCCAGIPFFLTDHPMGPGLSDKLLLVSCRDRIANPLEPVLVAIDRGTTTPPPVPLMNWLATKYHNQMPNPTMDPNDVWNERNLGSIFGLTFDPRGNIYASASSAYQIDAFPQGAGAIYQIRGSNGKIERVQNLPQDPLVNSGLGNISFGSCSGRPRLYVTNMFDGTLYSLDSSGTIPFPIVDAYDPFSGINDSDGNGWADLGERLWAVEYHNGRVYFSVWREDRNRVNPLTGNEVFSVKVDALGQFDPSSLRLEIPFTLIEPVPQNPPVAPFSNPISDISFTPQGTMLIAERTMLNDTEPFSHTSRVLEFQCQGTQWVPTAHIFEVGDNGQSAAGGIDSAYDPNEAFPVWTTSDAMEAGPNYIYGVQGLATTGSNLNQSLWIDLNEIIGSDDKTENGDAEIPCMKPSPVLLADLGIRNLQILNAATVPGDPLRGSFTLFNIGTSPSQETAYRVGLSVGTGNVTSLLYDVTTEIEALPAGGLQMIEFEIAITPEAGLGEGLLQIEVDPNRRLVELDEGNNKVSEPIYIFPPSE